MKSAKTVDIVARAIQRADLAELGFNPRRAKLTDAYRNAARILMLELKRAGIQVTLRANSGGESTWDRCYCRKVPCQCGELLK